MSATAHITVEQYAAAFHQERLVEYRVIDAIEQRCGYALDRQKLEAAARVLACPVKKSPPNWQHGRVLYAITRQYAARLTRDERIVALDIGTAKGFSAICLYWAIWDSDRIGGVHSVDVRDPNGCEPRNTVAEVGEPKNLYEIMEPWPETSQITFYKSTGQKWLQEHDVRVRVAFVDGKHSYEAVSWEGALLAERQQTGDLVMFDDVQIEGVAKAVKELRAYDVEYVDVLPNRRYAIGVRK
jgi:hypothetical protein